MTRIGEQIPDVRIQALRGNGFETITLRARHERWLVRLDELEVDVISISTDTVYAHKAWSPGEAALTPSPDLVGQL